MKQPIKILQVFTVLNKGGAETNVMNYYRKMDKEQFQMDFLVHRESGFFEEEIRSLGGRIFRLPPIHPLKLRAYKRAVRNFFSQHSDYDIIHGQLSELGVFVYREAKRRGIPVIIAHAHNAPCGFDSKSIFRHLWKKRMNSYISHRFTCGSDASIWLFGSAKAKEAFQMNNAVDISKFNWSSTTSLEIREKENISGNLNFINVGRFNKQKNQLFMLDVFRELVKVKKNAQLFLVGDGLLRNEIERKIKTLKLQNNVHLFGIRDDIADLLQGMDYFLMPSLFEGLPVSLVEAQTSGLKCFISDGVPSEGILVEDLVEVISLKKSPKEWAEIILQNLEYERKDVSDIIRAKGYDIRENAKKLEEKYIDLLREKHR